MYSRVGESIKIKLCRVCDSAWFAICMYIFWFATCCMYLFHDFVTFSTFVSPLGLHFLSKCAISLIHVFNDFLIKRFKSKWNPVEGICDTSQVRGELGHLGASGAEASGTHLGRHLGRHLEASGTMWNHLGGIWKPEGKCTKT